MKTELSKLSDDRAIEIARETFLYAYPLVLMDVTRRQLTNYVEPSDVPGTGPENRFVHLREFPNAQFKMVVRPNVDTLYSTAWLDLEAEPMLLSVPPVGRYFMLPMLSMWTDVFAVPGTRTSGREAREYAVVGPSFAGKVPSDLEIIRAPTRYVWIIGRTQTNGIADYPNVHSIQAGYRLRPLSARGNPDYVPAPGKVDPSVDTKTPPPVQVENMDAATFYARFAALMKDNPPYFYDSPLIMQMERLGIRPGQEFDLGHQSPTVQSALARAMKEGHARIARAGETAGVKGWAYSPRGGFYGDDRLLRASIARFGLGMNLSQDAIYPSLSFDSEGKPLNGTSNYVLRFEKGMEPPVRAFWSITAYDAEGYLYPNTMNRCALGDRDKMTRGADGSISIYLQNDSPGKDKEANWLPVPRGPFNLLLRMYWPNDAILERTWTPPLARRVDLVRSRVAERLSHA
ncbi:MAG: DUF1254 domain-containing protein [Polyangiales bacterium]